MEATKTCRIEGCVATLPSVSANQRERNPTISNTYDKLRNKNVARRRIPPSMPFEVTASKRPPPVQSVEFSRRQWLFVAADLFCINSGALLAIASRFSSIIDHPHAALTLAGHVSISILFSVLIVLFCNTQGLYSVYQPISRFQECIGIFKSVLFATFLLGGSLFVSGIKSTSRLVVANTALFALFSMVGWRVFRRWSLSKAIADGLSCNNVIIVGTDPMAVAVAQHLTLDRQLGFVVLGHLGPAPSDPVGEAPKILGTPAELKNICRANFADEVIICSSHRPTVIRAISDARDCGLGVRVIPDLYDGMAVGARLHYLGDFPSMAVVNRSIPAVSMKLKRSLDVLFSGFALALLSPLLLLIAIVIKLDSTGRIFYVSRRVGKKGRPFSCYKFRTMVADADHQKASLHNLNQRDGILFKIAEDPRITRCGRFMRKYSLDEFPQLWNVLAGDMSLVGPRPPLVNEVKQYQLEYLRRLEAAPGITGLWQVEARNHPSFERYISLDLHYIENWSFSLDIYILFRTIGVVLAGTGS
jgi:exopolysaccharide biosynthesis polyprenyl glycosylphosphotransferase